MDLFGSNADEQVKIAQILGVYDEFRWNFVRYVIFLPKELYPEKGKENYEKMVVPYLRRLTKFIQLENSVQVITFLMLTLSFMNSKIH